MSLSVRRQLRSPRSARSSVVSVAAQCAVWMHRFRSGYVPEWDESGYLTIAISDAQAVRAGGAAALWDAFVHQPSQAPLVPLLTAPALLLFGDGLVQGLFVQLALYAALVAATYLLASTLLERRWAALACPRDGFDSRRPRLLAALPLLDRGGGCLHRRPVGSDSQRRAFAAALVDARGSAPRARAAVPDDDGLLRPGLPRGGRGPGRCSAGGSAPARAQPRSGSCGRRRGRRHVVRAEPADRRRVPRRVRLRRRVVRVRSATVARDAAVLAHRARHGCP